MSNEDNKSALRRRSFLVGSAGAIGIGCGAADSEFDDFDDENVEALEQAITGGQVIVSRNKAFDENVRSVVNKAGGVGAFINRDDVVVLKPNGQWRWHGYTHTGCMKALIDMILAYKWPAGGFTGEILIAEHVHRTPDLAMSDSYCWNMSVANRKFNWPTQHYNGLVAAYRNAGKRVAAVPLYDVEENPAKWASATGPGNLPTGKNGWVRTTYRTVATNNKVVRLSHPLIRSPFAASNIIDLNRGLVWKAGAYSAQKVKLIFLPTLNNHYNTNPGTPFEDYSGATSAVKCHLGIVEFKPNTAGTLNLHQIGFNMDPAKNRADAVGESIGHLITKILRPTFYMTCAEYVGYQARCSGAAARANTVGLSLDPVSLDFWMCKNVLFPVDTRYTFFDPSRVNNLRKMLAACHAKGVGTLNPPVVYA